MTRCVRDGSISAVEVCVGDRIFFIKRRIEEDRMILCGEKKGGEKKDRAVVPLSATDEIIPALKEYMQKNFGGDKITVAICDKNRKEITI